MKRAAPVLLWSSALWVAGPELAHAHTVARASDAASWAWTILILTVLALSAGLYCKGLQRLWSRTGRGGGVRKWEAAAFAWGWLSTAVALLSPLDRWGEELFSAHMVQHEILMLISAPLIVLGRPTVVWLWAFSRHHRRRLGIFLGHSRWSKVWEPFTHPLGAWTTYALVLWAWHAPALFEAAVVSDGVHALQHLSFFGAALLFWSAFVGSDRQTSREGVAVLANFTTAVHSSLLGAFLTFSTTAWYAPYLATAENWGLSPLEDQQLAGLMMWVPGGLVHLAAGLAATAHLIHQAELRAAQRKRW